MPYLIEKPTESDYADSRILIRTGSLMFFGAMAILIVIRLIIGLPLTAPWQHVVNVGFAIMSFGLAAILWGLRVHARNAEFRSATKSGMTPAYEAACTMIAIVFALAPIVAGLIAFDVIELPSFPETNGGM